MLALLIASVLAPAHAADAYLTYQGRVSDTLGQPIDGTETVIISLHTSATASGADVWSKSFSNIDFDDGYFSLPLTGNDATSRSLDDALSTTTPLYVGIAVGSATELAPRSRLGTSVGGAGVAPTVTEVAGDSCTTVGAYAFNDSNGHMLACDGTAWFTLSVAPKIYRYWRVILTVNDTAANEEYLGGFSVFSGLEGTGENRGLTAGSTAYTLHGSRPGSRWDPAIPSSETNFMDLSSRHSSTSGGRVQCGDFPTAGDNCFVQIDLGSPQSVRSWGLQMRQNSDSQQWRGVRLDASNDGTTWTTVDDRVGYDATQNGVVHFNLP